MRPLRAFLVLLFAVPALARPWTDHSGKYTIEATLADFQNGVAYLKKDSGKFAAVPLAKLSAADQQFIQESAPPVKVIEGKVIGIADGDTLAVLDGETPKRIRLHGIDAPEGHQAFGAKSKQALSRLLGKHVKIEWREEDQYKRILGHIFVDDRWINKDMVQVGWAWHYREYSDSEVLAAAEREARETKAGLWADDYPTPPWDFRRNEVVAKTESTPKADPPKVERPDTVETTVYATRTGAKYHRDGCRYLSKSRIPMSLSEATARYTPCSVCRPPSGQQASIDKPEPVAASAPTYVPSSSSGKTVHVKGYYRKDGTYVRPHTRRPPSR